LAKPTTVNPLLTIGLDVSDRTCEACVLDSASGDVLERFGLETTRSGLERRLGGRGRARVVIEAGGHSPWMSRTLAALGHEVIVANPRKVRLIAASDHKTDRVDAETLARLGRADVRLLHPVRHRSEKSQRHLALMRARDQLVGTRTALINHVRGAVKSFGARIPSTSAEAFATKAKSALPADLSPALEPLLETIAGLTASIRRYDAQVEALCEHDYPETSLLREVKGVGPLTALAFVVTLESPKRFRRSRQVGAYLGLRPRMAQSGDTDPQLPITKAGDTFLRRLLVSSAHYILGPFGPDCALRRIGLRLMATGGASAKKRAVVAIARRLAVLLHSLWKTAEIYDPMRNVPPAPATA
jgi:transposase